MKNFRITPSLAVILVLVILVSIAALRYDGFLGTYNVQSVLRYNSMFALVALGMCFVIMTGGIDLSVGSVAAMCSVVSALAQLLRTFPGPCRGHRRRHSRRIDQWRADYETQDFALHRHLGHDAGRLRNRPAPGRQPVRFGFL